VKRFLAYLKAELLEALRTPAFLVPTLVFPSMFFLLFAAPNLKTPSAANFTALAFMIFAVFGVVFFQYGVGTAFERENPWFAHLKTMPAPPLTRPLAQVTSSLLVAFLAAFVLYLTARLSTPLAIPPDRWPKIALALLLGTVPMGLFGLAIGQTFNHRAAIPVANLIYLPLSFIGGLWMPPAFLPEWAQKISTLTPTRHWAELAWHAAVHKPWPLDSLLGLGFYTLLFGAFALWASRRPTAR